MSEITPIQAKLLQMMDWFHIYCEEHGLRYYMIGGTMLGAVRHRGFIPWDDDIDVGMPRKDYELFLKLMRGRIVDNYFLESYMDGAPDYTVPFAKLYDTTTTLIEERRPLLKRGLFLDVFPLDGVDNTAKWKRDYKAFRVNKNLLAVLTARMHKQYGLKLNTLILLSSFVPRRMKIVKELQNKIDIFCSSSPFSIDKNVANLVGSRKEKEILPGSFFGKPSLYLFEGRMYYGVEEADKYLSTLIGDYMTLPPVSERQGHLTDCCDLSKGYMS